MEADGLGKLTKAEIVDAIYNKTNVDRREIQSVVDLFLEEIKSGLISRKAIELRGFGTFEIKIRKGREKARNPKTGEFLTIHPHGIALFRAGRELRQDVWNLTPGDSANPPGEVSRAPVKAVLDDGTDNIGERL
jgi:integration host factor subunit beta